MKLYSNYFKTHSDKETSALVTDFFEDVFTDFNPYRDMTSSEAHFITKRCDVDEYSEEVDNIYYDIINTRKNEVYAILDWDVEEETDNSLFFELCAEWNAFVKDAKYYSRGIVVDMVQKWREDL